MDREALINATIRSLWSVKSPRFFENERGYQGEFHVALHIILEEHGILSDGCILEIEYQKSSRHGIHQRPDIILHIPAEVSGVSVSDNNYAVWALKRRATGAEAVEDFSKLDDMFRVLNYPVGFFINLDSNVTYIDRYVGDFRERLITFAVRQEAGDIEIVMGRWNKDGLIIEQLAMNRL